jgi:hypothetical protein
MDQLLLLLCERGKLEHAKRNTSALRATWQEAQSLARDIELGENSMLASSLDTLRGLLPESDH